MDKIEVTTEYTYPVYRKFYFFAIYRRSTGRFVFQIVLDVLYLLVLILSGAVGVMTKDYTTFGYLVFLGIFLAAFTFLLPRINYKGLIASKGIVSKSTFTDECITSEASGTGMQMTEKYVWDSIHSAYETISFFYIFIARNQGIIVDKSKMSAQEITWLGGMLANKLGDKFKVR